MAKVNLKKIKQPIPAEQDAKITWVNFLHIYQPPWQQSDIIRQAASESYEYLLALLENYPKFKMTLNISGTLLEQLEIIRPDLLAGFQAQVNSSKVELTGSSKHHALLPLLPASEIKRQILLHEETINKYFKVKLEGFYLPEMAYSYTVAKIIKDFGYRWIILDPICYAGKISNEVLYQIKNIGLQVIFRNREISKSYPAEVIYHKLSAKRPKTETIITGLDGEIYGHHHEDWQGHIEKILQQPDLVVCQISEYLTSLKETQAIRLRAASWESQEKELAKHIPFSLWHDPKNAIHSQLWKLVGLAVKLVNQYPQDQNFFWARQHLDRGLSSCTFWWASASKPSDFSPLTWNPDMIDNGSEELVRSVRSLKSATMMEKIKAEKLYIAVKKITWETHWRKYN